ncbi:MAG TPA: sigma 54-interacting transcriptional regulator [Polyangiaceae bacterium]|jgi:DNA-binding NtrC family response regulator/pSer/pThr/pTyr-binding forkhead associated (FHA) protein|nr:sigma 54-interacting transcriptional regulator [Polyangiaceae bacterium]
MNTGRHNPIEGPTAFDPGTAAEAADGVAAGIGFRVYLLVREGEKTRVVDVPDAGSVIFGRAPEASVRIDDNRASRRHAELRRNGRELVIIDLGSRNGTKVNDRRLRDESLAVVGGDVIKVGPIEALVATAETRGGGASSSRLERELADFGTSADGRAVLIRIVMDLERSPDGLVSLTELLGPMAVVEERGDGEYAALLEEQDPRVVERVLSALKSRPGVQVTIARFPENGRTAADLWTHASRGASAPPVVADTREGVVVADPAMVQVFQLARRLASVQTTVLILGETGVGKEVIAEQIHHWSARAQGPFVRLNCASLPETLLESELFGHERGAFTGADRRKIGYLEAAQGGTLFLDEIGELPVTVQVKLLNVLESREVRRLGGTQEHPIDVRVVSATHRDLTTEVGEGRFREDLYYRLSAFTLVVPPLRERQAEIPLIAEMFAREAAHRAGRPPVVMEASAVTALVRHPWPGNVRELKNAMEHAVVLADRGRIGVEHLPESVRRREAPLATGPSSSTVKDKLADLERRSIEEALSAEGGNQTRAARRLGMSRRALIYKIEKYGLRR